MPGRRPRLAWVLLLAGLLVGAGWADDSGDRRALRQLLGEARRSETEYSRLVEWLGELPGLQAGKALGPSEVARLQTLQAAGGAARARLQEAALGRLAAYQEAVASGASVASTLGELVQGWTRNEFLGEVAIMAESLRLLEADLEDREGRLEALDREAERLRGWLEDSGKMRSPGVGWPAEVSEALGSAQAELGAERSRVGLERRQLQEERSVVEGYLLALDGLLPAKP